MLTIKSMLKIQMYFALTVSFFTLVSCASPPAPRPEGTAASEPVVSKETPAAPVEKVVPVAAAKHVSTPQAASPPVASQPVKATPPAKSAFADGVWTLKKGKLQGAVKQPTAKIIAQTKLKKTPGLMTETCWNFTDFAIVESKSSAEVGAAEIYIRYPTPGRANLCAGDFQGRNVSLRINEGYFAGAAGELVVVDGADMADGLPEFQLFSIETGKEIFKSMHGIDEEFEITRKGGKSSLIFFAKVSVKCELALEPKECWPKVLKLNGIIKATPAPDCKAAFAKAKTPDTELALVTTRARVANVNSPKVEFLGGRATCAPAP